jgi:hypothetical protein
MANQIRIVFSRTGGFAGLRVSSVFEPGTLPSSEEDEIRRMVDQSGFFELPTEIAARSPGADRFVYQVTIEEAGKSHSVQVAEAAAPESLKPLLRRLTDLAGRQPRKPKR